MELNDTLVSERKKEVFEFSRDVVVGAENPRCTHFATPSSICRARTASLRCRVTACLLNTQWCRAGGKRMAEKVLQYFEKKLQGKDAQIQKLEAKNVSLQVPLDPGGMIL